MSITSLVFFLMLGAAFISFAIAWVMKQPTIQKLTDSLLSAESELGTIQNDHDKLKRYANELQQEKGQLLKANDRLTDKLLSLTNTTNRLRAQKTVIFDNYENDMIDTASFDQQINDLNAHISKLNEEIEVVKKENMQWKIRYDELQKENEALQAQLRAQNGNA